VLAALAVSAAAPAAAQASYGSVPADSAAKPRKKAKKCKRGQVRYVIGKKRTCRALKKAFPRPKKGDPRLIFARAAIPGTLKGLRDKKGRRPPSIEKRIRRISPRALKVFENRALPKAIQMIDQLAARRAASASSAVASQAPGSTISASFDLGNGVSIDLRAKLAGQATVEVAITGRNAGQLVRTTIGANLDLGFRAPQCPTSAGELDGKDGLRVSITTELLDDDRSVDYYYTNVIFQDTKMQGIVGDDAKLKTLEITDKLQIGEYTGGSIWGGSRIESVARRHTVVNMKTGQYDPGRSNVQVSVALSGILRIFQSSATAGATQRLQKAADEGFAATVKRAMEKYKERESAWQTPNRCAKVKFNPVSGARPLETGQRGSVQAETLSNQDNKRPPTATWTGTGIEGGALPQSAGGNPTSLAYAVGVGPRLRGVYKAVSRAGIGEAEWKQPIRSFEINEIAGNFSGTFEQVTSIGTSHVSWTASGTFVRQTPPGIPGATGSYLLKAGIASYHFSGLTITGHADCNMSGSAVVDLFQDAGGSIGVSPVDFMNPFKAGPQNYGGSVSLGPDPMVTLTMSSCSDTDENDKQYEWPVGYPPLQMGAAQRQSPDGIHYDGSYTDSQGPITYEYTWVLTGRKTP
jgi:hypothetical protein